MAKVKFMLSTQEREEKISHSTLALVAPTPFLIFNAIMNEQLTPNAYAMSVGMSGNSNESRNDHMYTSKKALKKQK